MYHWTGKDGKAYSTSDPEVIRARYYHGHMTTEELFWALQQLETEDAH